jgi:phage protein D
MPQNLQINDLPVSYELKISGKPVSGEVEVIAISVSHEINKISQATIKIADGGAFGLDNQPFTNSDSALFIPGEEIEIDVGYGDDRSCVFKGVIISQKVTVKSNSSHIAVTCRDKAFKLTKSRFNSFKTNTKDSDFIQSIISKAGLTASVVSTNLTHDAFQYNVSDWDYLVVRAEANDAFVLTDGGKVEMKSYSALASSACTIQADLLVIEMDLEISGENIFPDVNFHGWDIKNQQDIKVSKPIKDPSEIGNLTAKKIAEALKTPSLHKYAPAISNQEELTSVAATWISKSALTKIQGRIVIPGTTELKPGTTVALKKFPERYEGDAFLSKVFHDFSNGNWITTLGVGVSPRWHADLPDVMENQAIGIVPGITSVQIGVVKKIHEDPDGQYRVQVTVQALNPSGSPVDLWARLVCNYASSTAGFFFFPEINDEVLLDFIGGDPRHPVIIGSMYSAKNKPKLSPDASNSKKSIQSKAGISILFDEKDKILTISTPGGNEIKLSDKDKKVEIKDSHSNTISLSDSGIKLNSPKDITIQATGQLTLKATKGVKIEASAGDLAAKGLNVKIEAQATLKAAGNASAELSAAGQTVVKGAMVMIN